MASSSSSHQRNKEKHAFLGIEPHCKRRKVLESSRLFDVFINHRGPDVKQTVALQLYKSLMSLQIPTFLDSEEKELGIMFPSTIENAIHSASVHISIFSKGYAESPWCLAELVLMLHSRAKIIPVFYGVKPSDLRFPEKGVYAKAFTEYEKKNRYIEKLEEWKRALHEVSFCTGTEIASYRTSDCGNIVSAVQKEVKRRKSLYVAKYPVGLRKLVEDFERRCLDELVEDMERECGMNETRKDDAQIVGIFGMGGVGKTTLSKELFNRKQSHYTRACFLFDVREAHASNSFPSLQMKLLKDLFQQDQLSIQCTEEGKSHIAHCIERSKPLSFIIVVDDVEHVQQLDDLLVMDMVRKSDNSLVIVTTRDEGVLINRGITTAYNLKCLERDDARELFCCHAFGQRRPANDYDNLVESFLDVCGGLPLSVQVLGSHVYGRDQNYWILELNKVRKIQPREVHLRLKISFDALDYEEQQIFVDIACFFVDKLKSIAMRVWEGSGWSAQHALETLKNKCLVQEIENGIWVWEEGKGKYLPGLRMHDHLRDLGREMANRLTPRRLWSPQDLQCLESKGFRNILNQTKGRCFHSFFDKSTNSRITYFLGESDASEKMSTLLWLQLDYEFWLRSEHENQQTFQPRVPSWIPLQNLQCLIISNLRLKTLWQSHTEEPSQLKELQIYNTILEEFPDLAGQSNSLEKVVLDAKLMHLEGWSLLGLLGMNLSTLHLRHSKLNGKLISNIGTERTACKYLSISNFKSGEILDLGNGRESGRVKALCSSLENLEIKGEKGVIKILISGHCCLNLQSFKLYDMDYLFEVQFTKVKTLKSLEVINCKRLTTLSALSDLKGLVHLKISKCPELQKLCVVQLSCLESIEIQNCYQLRSVSGIADLRKTVELKISQCPQLQEDLNVVHLSCLEQITIQNCNQLRTVTGISNLRKLVELNISVLPEIQELCVEHLSYLQNIIINNCSQLRSVTGISNLQELRELNIFGCPELQELSIAYLSRLEKIKICHCSELRSMSAITNIGKLAELYISWCPALERLSLAHLSSLEKITINYCSQLRSVSGISNLPQLVELDIFGCRELQELSVVRSSCLERLKIHYCNHLRTVSGLCDLKNLVELNIKTCPNIQELRLEYLSCLTRITIENCIQLRSVSGISHLWKVLELNISKCPEIQELTVVHNIEKLVSTHVSDCMEIEALPFQGPSSLETVKVADCGKLNSLYLSKCQNLKRVTISDCPEFNELPCFAHQTCLEKIAIVRCGKLQNINLPTGLVELRLEGCTGLKRVAGICDYRECQELQPLSNVATQSCLQWITVDTCENLKNLQGIEELNALKSMKILDSNGAIQSCIPKLKFAPSEFLGMIGRAVDGAQSALNQQLLSTADASIAEIDAHGSPKWEQIASEFCVVIVCIVIVVNSRTLVDTINDSLAKSLCDHWWWNLRVQEGEWIITMVTNDQLPLRSCRHESQFEDVFVKHGIMKKGYKMALKKGEEWKTRHILYKIVNRLYQI